MRFRAFAAAAALAGVAVLGSASIAAADDGPDGATAAGVTGNSPGILSGDNIQVPIHIPVNACGNSLDVIGLLNPAFGNACVNK
jgi:hypothetical protein